MIEYFDAWGNLVSMFLFYGLGGTFMWLARPSAVIPEGTRKLYKGAAIFSFVVAGINTLVVIGELIGAYVLSVQAARAAAASAQVEPMNAVIGGGQNAVTGNNNGGRQNAVIGNNGGRGKARQYSLENMMQNAQYGRAF